MCFGCKRPHDTNKQNRPKKSIIIIKHMKYSFLHAEMPTRKIKWIASAIFAWALFFYHKKNGINFLQLFFFIISEFAFNKWKNKNSNNKGVWEMKLLDLVFRVRPAQLIMVFWNEMNKLNCLCKSSQKLKAYIFPYFFYNFVYVCS